jgi:hypothetical protein
VRTNPQFKPSPKRFVFAVSMQAHCSSSSSPFRLRGVVQRAHAQVQ